MARRTVRAAVLAAFAVLGSALLATSAFAHAGNPNFESLVEGVTPNIPGFSVTVLDGDDRLEVINHSKQSITIYGYNDEPYLRMDPDGTVAVNIKSPAYYLDDAPTDTTPVPKIADPKATPEWKVIEHDGRYQFHDHRIHWMAPSTPPQVTDKSKRTKVSDWRVPLQVGGKAGAISGTLFWRGSSGGPPAGAFVALIVILLLGGASVVVVRRRRAEAGDEDGGHGDGGGDGDGGGGGGSAVEPAGGGGAGGGGPATRRAKPAAAGGAREEAW